MRARLLVRPFPLEPRQAPLPLGVRARRPRRGLVAPRLLPGLVPDARRRLGPARRRRDQRRSRAQRRYRLVERRVVVANTSGLAEVVGRSFRRAGVGVGAHVAQRFVGAKCGFEARARRQPYHERDVRPRRLERSAPGDSARSFASSAFARAIASARSSLLKPRLARSSRPPGRPRRRC